MPTTPSGYLLIGYLNGTGDLNLLELDANTPRVPYVRPGQEDPPPPPVPPVVTLPPVVLPPAAPDCAAAEKRAKEAEALAGSWRRVAERLDVAVRNLTGVNAKQAKDIERLTAVEKKNTDAKEAVAGMNRYLRSLLPAAIRNL